MTEKKFFNPHYSQDDFDNEVDRLFKSGNDTPLGHPSLNACIRFIENLPSEEEKEENIPEDIGNDAEDYKSWGYAIYGDWEDAEDEGHQMWKWYRLYTRMLNNLGSTEPLDFPNYEALGDFLEDLT